MIVNDEATNGILIAYMLSLGAITRVLLRTSSTLTKLGVNLQRLKDYAEWEDHEKSFNSPKPDSLIWPSNGDIEIENLCVRYRRGLPLALKNVNISIKSGENIGIVGRTGSGKSTIMLALMRILEIAEKGDEEFELEKEEADGKKPIPGSGIPLGKISISGVNIQEIGLHYLRKNIAVIPQDPFLLEGTLKFNIDPFNTHSDEEIISALRQVKVLDSIQKSYDEITHKEETESSELNTQNLKLTIKEKLDYKIESNGSNLSLGQKQLICIARALVKKPKILLMDEATANIDEKTDSVIQKIIKEELCESTVITVAHRLSSITRYDRIVVLEEGEKIEEGSPLELLEEEGSWFRRAVLEGGEEFYEGVLKAAKEGGSNFE